MNLLSLLFGGAKPQERTAEEILAEMDRQRMASEAQFARPETTAAKPNLWSGLSQRLLNASAAAANPNAFLAGRREDQQMEYMRPYYEALTAKMNTQYGSDAGVMTPEQYAQQMDAFTNLGMNPTLDRTGQPTSVRPMTARGVGGADEVSNLMTALTKLITAKNVAENSEDQNVLQMGIDILKSRLAAMGVKPPDENPAHYQYGPGQKPGATRQAPPAGSKPSTPTQPAKTPTQSQKPANYGNMYGFPQPQPVQPSTVALRGGNINPADFARSMAPAVQKPAPAQTEPQTQSQNIESRRRESTLRAAMKAGKITQVEYDQALRILSSQPDMWETIQKRLGLNVRF